MAVLVTAIHAFLRKKDVDGRTKSGHDGGDVVAWVNRILVSSSAAMTWKRRSRSLLDRNGDRPAQRVECRLDLVEA